MTEIQKEVYIILYVDDEGECPHGHCRLVNERRQAEALLKDVQRHHEGRVLLVRGQITGETTEPERENGWLIAPVQPPDGIR